MVTEGDEEPIGIEIDSSKSEPPLDVGSVITYGGNGWKIISSEKREAAHGVLLVRPSA
jgi:hypothetical protein